MTLTLPTPITADRLETRNRERIARARVLLKQLEDPGTSSGSVLPLLNDAQVELANVGSECRIYVAMHPEKEVRDTAEKLVRETSEIDQELHQSRPLYERLGALEQDAAVRGHERRVVELVRMDMRRTGVALGSAERAHARALRAELTKLGQDHARNIRDDTRYVTLTGQDALAGLPPDYVAAHQPGADGVVRISTNPPDHSPFMTYAHSERARKAVHKAYLDRAPDNLRVLAELTKKRHELARVLGYPTWAHYNLEERMCDTPEKLDAFLVELDDASRDTAAEEFAALLEEKRRDAPGATTIGEWESAYYANRLRTRRYGYNAQEVRPYLEYRRVRQAILDLNSELFGMTFTPVVHEERWHPSVESFDVTIDGRPAGRISLDMHPRQGKNKWFFNAPLVPGVGGRQAVHGVLNCNFPDPRAMQGPALMEHGHVVTYFHEFGHLVHGLARAAIPYVRLSRTEGDFMEAPSTFLEEWIFDHSVLSRFAVHVETEERIPERLVQRLRAARTSGRALGVREMLRRSRLSLALHDGTRPGADPRVLEAEMSARYSPFERIPDTNYPAAWEHMNGDHYSAAYYTYAWSRTIAQDLHTAFGGDLMNTEISRRYRDLILAPGGTKPAAELVRDFLGRPFDLRAYKAWINERA